MRKMFESLPVSGPQNPMTSGAVLSARLVMNAFCIGEVQHKAKRGQIGFHSELAVQPLPTPSPKHTHWRLIQALDNRIGWHVEIPLVWTEKLTTHLWNWNVFLHPKLSCQYITCVVLNQWHVVRISKENHIVKTWKLHRERLWGCSANHSITVRLLHQHIYSTV